MQTSHDLCDTYNKAVERRCLLERQELFSIVIATLAFGQQLPPQISQAHSMDKLAVSTNAPETF